MNWERIKTFLIILFIGINIFLIAFTMSSVHRSTSVTEAVVGDTVGLLGANGITVDGDIIPLSVNNPGTLDVMAITVKNSYQSPKAIDDGNAVSEIKKALRALGVKDTEISKKGENTYFIVQKIKNNFIYDSGITAMIDGNNIALEGVWYKQQTKPRATDEDLMPVTAILIDFMNNPNRDNNIHREISEIGVGYCVPQYDSGVNHKSMPAVPCYAITTKDGTVFLYDASGGTYLKNR